MAPTTTDAPTAAAAATATTPASPAAVDMVVPVVAKDPRFHAGRSLVQRGLSAEGGVDIFSTLLEETLAKYGDESSIEAAPAYYEYGNALHYATSAASAIDDVDDDDVIGDEKEPEENKDCDQKPAAATAVASKKNETTNDDQADKLSSPSSNDDLTLALEMIESALSILVEYQENASGSNSSDSKNFQYMEWVQDQLPRVYMGLGDLLSTMNRNADAADVYTQALELRKEQLKHHLTKVKKGGTTTETTGTTTAASSSSPPTSLLTLDLLKAHRLVCEAAVATAQALLNCPKHDDVITTTKPNTLLVQADELVSYVEGYYWQARDALQDMLLVLADLESKSGCQGGAVDQTTKEDVSHIATWVMGVGEELVDRKEEEDDTTASSNKEPQKKRAKWESSN